MRELIEIAQTCFKEEETDAVRLVKQMHYEKKGNRKIKKEVKM